METGTSSYRPNLVPKSPSLPVSQSPSLPVPKSPSLQVSQSPSPQVPKSPSLQVPKSPSPQSPSLPKSPSQSPSPQVSKSPSLPSPPSLPSLPVPKSPSPQVSKSPSLQVPKSPSLQVPKSPSPQVPVPKSPSPQVPKSPNMQVTVIIPTFKRLDYLEQAIDSVCQQTWQDFVCIVVNDYPADALAVEQLITSFDDDRLRLINHEVSGGGNAARNTGIQEAQGDIIAFLDDDDCWLPHKLEYHLQRHQAKPEVGVLFSGMTKHWSDDLVPDYFVKGRLPSEGVVAAMRQGTFCPLTTSAVSVRRECFTKCGLFDIELASFQDWDMWYRLANQYEFDYIQDALLIFRQHLGDSHFQNQRTAFLRTTAAYY